MRLFASYQDDNVLDMVLLCTCRYGQLNGMVEPLAGVFGTVAVVVRSQLQVILLPRRGLVDMSSVP